jgi:release factor glutamine methyltransferase
MLSTRRSFKNMAYNKEDMSENEPEAYREGWVPFLDLKIWLDSRPLIPRPETEWWTEELVQAMSKWPDELRFLDLCAGSGAIGCAVLKNVPNARVYFGEIDPAHESTILKNIRQNKLDESRAEIQIGDLFEPFGDMKFDFIATNPPYVPEGRELDISVEDFEPVLALRAGPDGLSVINRVAKALPEHIERSGQAWIECDSEYAKQALKLFRATGFVVQIRNDQYDRPRLLVVSFPHD